jgi:hypothetical protein
VAEVDEEGIKGEGEEGVRVETLNRHSSFYSHAAVVPSLVTVPPLLVCRAPFR